MKFPSLLSTVIVALGLSGHLWAGGTLTPVGSTHQPIAIRDHQVHVTLNNGFAQTVVHQTFFNPNTQDLEALYAFPVPKSASLSEVTYTSGEKTLQGEVLARPEAQAVYEEEKKAGNDAGLASQNGIQTFEFRVGPVRAQSEVTLRFVYYQPLEIDLGVGRYVYPLEDGGTDDVARSFWTKNSAVEGKFSVDLELKSAAPVADVRVPGFEGAATVQKLDEGHYRVGLDRPGARLDRDFVFYYRLIDTLPGRVELIPYRADASKPGTFMMIVTPGIDLKPITRGADYVFVLDTSGSMQGKIATLVHGVTQALGSMKPDDRFRLVTFNQRAEERVPWTAATPENVQQALEAVKNLRVTGGTNLYGGLVEGLKGLDSDRATSLILVTDGVANQGVIDPASFHRLLKQVDLRLFGFLMGNSANWPLMRTLADATGGTYAGISNADDIVGQLLLARSKITHEALHDAAFTFSGVTVSDTTGDLPQKIHRGQQWILFGRYEKAGRATVTLRAKLTGEDKTYSTTFDFPEIDTENPEIERLWALAQIEQIELKESMGALPASESKDAIQSLGIAYQLVTDHTAMVLLDDETFAKRGISRNNQQRIAVERDAQSRRAGQPIRSFRVDAAQPAFPGQAPHVNPSGGSGGGALSPEAGNALLILVLLAAVLCARPRLGRRNTDAPRR